MNKKLIVGIVIVVVIVLIVIANISKGAVPTFSGKIFDVKVKGIERGEISSVVTAGGIVEGTEKVEVYYDAPMKVEKILVEENQKVTKGQPLVELDLSSLTSELDQLKINKEIQELNIKKLKIADSTRSIASLQSAVDIAQKEIENFKRLYDEAIKEYESSKELFAANAISRSEFNRAVDLKNDAEIALNNAKQRKESAEENLAEVKKSNSQSKESKELELQVSEKNLEATKLQIDVLEKRIEKIKSGMLSPIDGVITKIDLEEGGFTNAGMSAFSILNLNKIKIRTDVKEFYIKEIEVGQDVVIVGDAIGKEENVTGVVESISPIAKKKITPTGEETLVEVLIAINEGSPVLKPGLTVTGKITTSAKKDALIVSFDMLSEDAEGNKIVFVVDKDNKMNKVPVKLGITSELDAEVIEGLNEGDRVVLYPKPNYTDGAAARILKDN